MDIYLSWLEHGIEILAFVIVIIAMLPTLPILIFVKSPDRYIGALVCTTYSISLFLANFHTAGLIIAILSIGFWELINFHNQWKPKFPKRKLAFNFTTVKKILLNTYGLLLYILPVVIFHKAAIVYAGTGNVFLLKYISFQVVTMVAFYLKYYLIIVIFCTLMIVNKLIKHVVKKKK